MKNSSSGAAALGRRVEGRTPDRTRTLSKNKNQQIEPNLVSKIKDQTPIRKPIEPNRSQFPPVTSATDTYFALCEGLVVAGLAG